MVEELVLDPLTTLWNSFISVLPGISAFIVLIALGILVSWIVGKIAKGILIGTGFDRWFYKSKLDQMLGKISPSAIAGTVIKWWVFIAFFSAAAEVLNLGPISDLLFQLAQWLPNAIIAVLIVLFGWVAASILATKITHKDVPASIVLAAIVKVLILVIIALIALSQIGIKVSVAENGLLVILAGIMLGVGLAIGKGFGPALEKNADKIIKNLQKGI